MEEQCSHTDLECAALAWLGRPDGLLLSLPALGEGTGIRSQQCGGKWGCGAATPGHSMGAWLSRAILVSHKSEWEFCPKARPGAESKALSQPTEGEFSAFGAGAQAALGRVCRGCSGHAWEQWSFPERETEHLDLSVSH